jgi:hypothetical protein
MHRSKILIAQFMLCTMLATQANTVVYNLRISQITRQQVQQITGKQGDNVILFTNLFQQWFKFRCGIKQTITGTLVSYIQTKQSWYIKLDGALAHVHNLFPCTELKRNQTDDILISVGYGIIPRENTRISFTGIVGIPTHKDTILDGIQFGTGHYALGGQLDGSQAYTVGRPHFLLWALRYIHFFPRTVQFDDPTRPQRYDFALGNLVDVYISHQSNWDKRHRIEFGYDGIFDFNTRFCPSLTNVNVPTHFVRNSYFVAYARRIKQFNRPGALIFVLSYSSDAIPRINGEQYGVALFFSWAIIF